MASEIHWVHTATGATVYATIRSAARTYWYTVTPALEDLTMAHWADYDIALAETPASSYFYVGDWPAALSTVGFYWVDVFSQAGAGPVRADDTLLGTLIGYWNGTALLPWATDTEQVGGTAQTAGDIVANQTTILNRLGAWTGTGVNTLLGAFKALLSKVASAPSDIGGTFDPATDSVEAIRDRGDVAWITDSSGASSKDYTVTIDGSPGAGVYVKMTSDAAGVNQIDAGTTNALGVVTLHHDLSAGTTVYLWRSKTGVEFTDPDTEVI